MDPSPAAASRRRPASRGGKGSRLGLKKHSVPAPSPPAPAASSPTAPAASSPAAPAASSPAAPASSSPAAPASSSPAVPSWIPQGAGWGGIPPNFASVHGNPQEPNLWGYPQGGFVNMIRQNHPPQPQLHGENIHYVGHNMSFNPMSPPSPSVYGTPSPQSENMEANRAAKGNNKRYWTHEEEERLVISRTYME